MTGCTPTEIVVPDISVPVAAPAGNTYSSVSSGAVAPGSSESVSADPITSTTTNELAASSTEPIQSSDEPIVNSPEPVISSPEPVVSSTEPVTSLTKPITSSTEPVTSSTEPVTSSTKPVTSSTEPIISSTVHQSSQTTTTVSSENPPEENPSDGVIITNNIAIVGTRAMSLYGANPNHFKKYAEAINKYKEALPDVNVYSAVIPTACEYYAPPEIAAMSASQLSHINIVNKNLVDVQAIDAYSALAQHVDEDIYLRTDHHWAPLGGFYVAQEFAKAADVPFLPLSEYTEHVNKGFCGTMYGYSGNNEIIANNPEDFVYYTPKNVEYTSTYYNYKISGWDVIGAYEPVNAAFFIDYGDDNSNNYCTFMVGDAKIVHVKTSTQNGRKLGIIKDSYGNAMAGYLFGSFEDIYVMDLRFFSHNMIDYITENEITDLLFVNNVTIAGNKSMSDNLDTIRTQEDMGF